MCHVHHTLHTAESIKETINERHEINLENKVKGVRQFEINKIVNVFFVQLRMVSLNHNSYHKESN